TTISLDTCNYPYNKINVPSPFLTPNSTGLIKDSSFNSCLCYTPQADFYYYSSVALFSDSSKWATHWYWSFGDGTYDSIQISPFHYYKDTGTYNVCLIVKNSCGRDSICKTIDYPNILTVGINTISDNNKTVVFPNPFTTSSTIQFSEAGKHYMQLYDITGRQLRTMESDETQYTLQRNNLAQGIYILKVFDGQMKYETSLKLVME
ncbi:MAG: PKD domain-containing protein, partial [Alphaproteobacteria bacterium]